MKSLEVIVQEHIEELKRNYSGGMSDYYKEFLENILIEYYKQLESKETIVNEVPMNYPFM